MRLPYRSLSLTKSRDVAHEVTEALLKEGEDSTGHRRGFVFFQNQKLSINKSLKKLRTNIWMPRGSLSKFLGILENGNFALNSKAKCPRSKYCTEDMLQVQRTVPSCKEANYQFFLNKKNTAVAFLKSPPMK